MLESLISDFINDFDNAMPEQRFVLGRSEYAASVAREYDLAGFIDDVTEERIFMGLPIWRSYDVPKESLVLSASMLRPHSAKKVLDSLSLRNLDYFAFAKHGNQNLKHVTFWKDFNEDYSKNESRYSAIKALLSDGVSVSTWESVINFRLTSDIEHTKNFAYDPINQYFDSLIGLSEKDSVFYDVGCFDGDTSAQFVSRSEEYAHVYGFEPDPENAKKANKRLEGNDKFTLIPFGLSDIRETVTFASNLGSSSHQAVDGNIQIELAPLDSLDLLPPTFIKMDIEGGEIAAIKGAKQTIATHSPLIAISVYHRFDDLYSIPELILSINHSYSLYLRHYTEGIDETVMFFVPTKSTP